MTISASNEHKTRRRLPEERPAQILDAALAVFGEKGLAGARLDDIAQRAGVAKGTIYLYFPNKEALFREVVRSTIVSRIEEAERHAEEARTGSAVEQLADYMARWWTFLRSPAYGIIYRLVIGELHRFPDLVEFYVHEVVERALGLVMGIISRGIAAGEFRTVDPRVVARVTSAAMTSHALWCGQREISRHLTLLSTDDDVLAQLLDFVLHSLRPTATPTAAPRAAARKR